MQYLLVTLFMLVSFCVGAQTAPAKAKNFFGNKTKIDNPFSLRDPFKAPFSKAEGTRQGRGGNFRITGKGQYSNIGEIPYGQLSIGNMKVVGVLIGKERRAMVTNGADKKIFVLKEGMKLGPENAELKAILPGGIVLVEKMVNVYGEEEYLETVIPISK